MFFELPVEKKFKYTSEQVWLQALCKNFSHYTMVYIDHQKQ